MPDFPIRKLGRNSPIGKKYITRHYKIEKKIESYSLRNYTFNILDNKIYNMVLSTTFDEQSVHYYTFKPKQLDLQN